MCNVAKMPCLVGAAIMPFVAAVSSDAQAAQSSAQAQASECRTAALPDGTPALFCKDRKGNWKQQDGKVEVAPAAASAAPGQQLYANASYRGPVTIFLPVRQRPQRNRSLLDLAVNAAASNTQKEEIFVSVEMRIEGPVVSGTITGGSWRNKVPFTGTRKNGICDISASLNGDTTVYTGKCDASGFVGTMAQYPARGGSAKGTVQLSAVSFTDTSQRDTRRAELKAQCDAGSNTACVELDQLN